MSELQRIEQLERNQDKLFDRIRLLELSQSKTDQKLDHISCTLNNLVTKIESIMMKPANRWEKIIASGISAGVGGIMGFLISKMAGG